MKDRLNHELSEYIKLCRFKKKISQIDIANKLDLAGAAIYVVLFFKTFLDIKISIIEK